MDVGRCVCSFALQEEHKFCPNCGRPRPAEEVSKKEQLQRCPNPACQKALKDFSKFCPECGFQLEVEKQGTSTNESNDAETDPTEKRRNEEVIDECNNERETTEQGEDASEVVREDTPPPLLDKASEASQNDTANDQLGFDAQPSEEKAAIATSSSDQPETVVAAEGDNGKHTSIVCLDHEESHVAHECQPSSTKQPVENEHEGMEDLDVKSSSPSSKDAPLQGLQVDDDSDKEMVIISSPENKFHDEGKVHRKYGKRTRGRRFSFDRKSKRMTSRYQMLEINEDNQLRGRKHKLNEIPNNESSAKRQKETIDPKLVNEKKSSSDPSDAEEKDHELKGSSIDEQENLQQQIENMNIHSSSCQGENEDEKRANVASNERETASRGGEQSKQLRTVVTVSGNYSSQEGTSGSKPTLLSLSYNSSTEVVVHELKLKNADIESSSLPESEGKEPDPQSSSAELVETEQIVDTTSNKSLQPTEHDEGPSEEGSSSSSSSDESDGESNESNPTAQWQKKRKKKGRISEAKKKYAKKQERKKRKEGKTTSTKTDANVQGKKTSQRAISDKEVKHHPLEGGQMKNEENNSADGSSQATDNDGEVSKKKEIEPKISIERRSSIETRSKKKAAEQRAFAEGTGNPDELVIHFFALVDPCFGPAENFHIVFGYPIGNWLTDGPRIVTRCVGKHEEYEIIHGTVHLPSNYKEEDFRVRYKYVKHTSEGWLYEYIRRPYGYGITNRLLRISTDDWSKGMFFKYDNFVAPPDDPPKGWTSFFTSLWPKTKRPVYLSDLKEFTLCISAFMPSWEGFGKRRNIQACESAQEAIMKIEELLRNLSRLQFYDSSRVLERYTILATDSVQIFCHMFQEKIEENSVLFPAAKTVDVCQKVFISTLAITHILIFSLEEGLCGMGKKLLTKIVDSLSLQKFQRLEVSSNDLALILSSQFDINHLWKLKDSLVKFLLAILQRYDIVKETLSWWSICALIEILDKILETETEAREIERMLKARKDLAFRVNETQILEIEAALYFAPKVQKLMLPNFGFDNMESFLKYKTFVTLDLLSALKNVLKPKKFLNKEEVVKIDFMLCSLFSRMKAEDSNEEWCSQAMNVVIELIIYSLTAMNFETQAGTFLYCLQIFNEVIQKVDQLEPGALESMLKVFEKNVGLLMSKLKSTLYERNYRSNLNARLKFLDLFLRLPLAIHCFKESWDDQITDILNSVINEKMRNNWEDLLEVVCKADGDDTSEKMRVIFNEALTRIIDGITSTSDHRRLVHLLSEGGNTNALWRLCRKVFQNENSDLQTLQTLLEWPVAIAFIKLKDKCAQTEERKHFGHTQFIKALEIFQQFEEKLKSAAITCEELDVIKVKQPIFCDISVALQNLSGSGASTHRKGFSEILAARLEESKQFEYWRREVTTLIRLCESSTTKNVDVSELKEMLNKDTFRMPLGSLCASEDKKTTIHYFALPKDLEQSLGHICLASASSIFREEWEYRCQAVDHDVTLVEIVSALFKPVTHKLLKYVTSLFDGSITLQRTSRMFKEFKIDGKLADLNRELERLLTFLIDEDGAMMEYSKDEIDEVAKKVLRNFKLQISQKRASNFINLGKSLKLEGNFEIFKDIETKLFLDKVDMIASSVYDEPFMDLFTSYKRGLDRASKSCKTTVNMNNTQLKSLQESHFKASESLDDVTDEMEKCMDTLLHCLPLITWLREDFKNGLRDVKTFVDLLSISAGESDYETDRVSCLHTVCLTFESIIFELKPESGPVELIESCKAVLGKIEKDSSLLDKLMDSNRLLEWFKNAEKSYGSVAVSSMMEAEAANRRGYYRVGASEQFEVQSTDISLENSLRLCVPEEGKESNGINKVYNLSDIGDLQSKLMLIGGKEGTERELGQIEKDYFLRMFESVTRVASLYVTLCNAGCNKYVKWNRVFRCQIEAAAEDDSNVIQEIEDECALLENDLEEWKQKLHQKRWKYPHLNFFTVRQLMYLQKELTETLRKDNIKSVRGLSSQVFTLLEEIYPEINHQIFSTVLSKSSHDRHYGQSLKADDNWRRITRVEDKFVGVSLKEIEDFITRLERDGHDEDVAKAAMMECGMADFHVTSAWGIEHSDEEDKISSLATKMDEIMEKKEEIGDDEMDTDQRDVQQIEEGIAAKREEELEFLSLDEVGMFLEELAKHRKKKLKNRKKIEIIHNKEPNLLIVPKDDLLCLLIDVYKRSGNCLPTAGEVEICNNNTSLEKVELLFRRALMDPSGIYTLAFIDELDYSVSEQAFRKLEILLKEYAERGDSKTNYSLLLMCSSEKEDISFLASALDNCRTVSQPCPPASATKDFLTSQCKIDPAAAARGAEHAAKADLEGSTVRVVKSTTSGTGKSLYIQRVGSKLNEIVKKSDAASRQLSSSVDTEMIVTISMQGTSVNQDEVVKALLPFEKKREEAFPRIYHFDIAATVTSNLDSFIFQLLVLGSISTSTGSLWKRKATDLYMLEITEHSLLSQQDTGSGGQKKNLTNVGNIIPLLPTTMCGTPKETFDAIEKSANVTPGFDAEEFKSVPYQRVYQYLKIYDGNSTGVDTFTFDRKQVRGDHYDCLRILLRYCGVADPSWREIKHFVRFFDNQISDCEMSVFCDHLIVGDTLPGFKAFVVKFMLQMSKDFATPSVDDDDQQNNNGLIILRRSWEKSEHPYLFFNQDRVTMSFLGFTVNRYGDLMDKNNLIVITRGIMHPQLYQGLHRQGVELFSQCDKWPRDRKIMTLCQVMGIEDVYDPDETYELTMDNMMKILAIHMRFRSGIPVILMGETGCGKTRLIRFMCKLKAGPCGPQNMLLVKVHGGVTEGDVKRRVERAVNLAQKNHKERRGLETVLFFDEANTTSAIGLIKEIMCDTRMAGKRLNLASCGLQIIAACNPYRKHTDDMIAKLESSGLGYNVKAKDATEKLGKIPLRQLVYRVHPLPESMLPLVWDFGQLSDETETLYAAQIVHRYARENKIPTDEGFLKLVISTLAASQLHMRKQKDECSFVSLRDVERAVQVLAWFYTRMDEFLPLIEETKKKLRPSDQEESEEEEDDDDDDDDLSIDEIEDEEVTKMRLSLVLALTVCYAARLEKRGKYYNAMAKHFRGEFELKDGKDQIKDDVYFCQQMFLDQLQLGDNIAKNTALSENVFMMVICIELRIPLFVVGKPGSSKSLAKTIIQDNMQGTLSHSDLFKEFKQILMCSYQCSPLSTAEGIIGTFRQCSRFQEGKDLDTFASVVVLDEVGLAEDSPRMPLKALHPLLEDGTDGSEDLTAEGNDSKAKRVAFVGISNWALDPAKMNRGLMLTRGQPDQKELVTSADGICSSDGKIKHTISHLFEPLARAYLRIYEEQRKSERLVKSKKEEFFGLRDYYSLIKMIFNRARKNKKFPTLLEIEHAVKRNFGGLEDFDTWDIFRLELTALFGTNDSAEEFELVDTSPVGLLRSSLRKDDSKRDTRYVLLMTENYAALRVLEKTFPDEYANASVIFGSSFPKDQEFTQICRDINKIKVCMETGMTVILLNMENLYESLYDALNQYYVYLGGQRYVDLGLGTHRVKCRVHEEFKLIVVAEKDTVYNSFPIPLINRLEKHFLVMSTSMDQRQIKLCALINHWAEDFAVITHRRKSYSLGDAFIGFNDDTAASVVLETMHNIEDNTSDEEILDRSRKKLLDVATPEAVTRLSKTPLSSDANLIWDLYFNEQNHSSLASFLASALQTTHRDAGIAAQVTTFSRLLSPRDQNQLEEILERRYDIKCISINQFQTEQQFSEEIRRYIKNKMKEEKMLLVQCDNGDQNSNLIASARHLCQQSKITHTENLSAPLHIIFIVNLRRVAHGCQHLGSFHGAHWLSIHIDELRPSSDELPLLTEYANQKMSYLFKPFGTTLTDVDTVDDSMESGVLAPGDSVQDEDGPNMHPEKEGATDELITKDSDDNHDDMQQEAEVITDDDAMMEATETKEIEPISPKSEEESYALQLALLRRCVQASVVKTVSSMDAEDGDRVTKRIHLLLDLLSQSGSFKGSEFSHKFAKVLLNIVYKVLKEKENQAIDEQPWFHDEAVSGNNIQECGTFRRALSYRIEKEVVPIFSRIITQIDKNSNLDLIIEDIPWKRELWLTLFCCKDILNLNLDDLVPFSRTNSKRMKTDVKFNCWFPFSSVIREKMIALFKAHIKDDSVQDARQVITTVLEQTQYGKDLLALTPKAVHAYLRDLVYLEFDITCEEHELIAMSVLARAKNQQKQNKRTSMDIIDLHLIIRNRVFRHRIDCFLIISQQMPDILKDIKRMTDDADDMVIDAVILHKCLEKLFPNQEEFIDEQSRFVWCNEVQQMKLAANQILDLFTQQQQGFSGKSTELLSDARATWTRIQVMRMFVEHVCPPGIASRREDVIAALFLWENLEWIQDDLSSVESWLTFEDALKNLSYTATVDENESSDIEGECMICNEALDDPVQLPCLHVVCFKCAHKWLDEDGHDVCPTCQSKLPADFKVPEEKSNRHMVYKLGNFKRRCIAFFMEAVSTFCFSSRNPLNSPEVIDLMMSYVTTEKQETKIMSPFPDYGVDPTPTVRSFLVQQLLKAKSASVHAEEYLRRYLENSKQLNEDDQQSRLELCLLLMHCYEDSKMAELSSKSSSFQSHVQVLYSKLQRIRDIAGEDRAITDISSLQMIAEIRVVMCRVAEIAYNDIIGGKIADEMKEKLQKMYSLLANTCMDSESQNPRNFFLRQLLRKYGSDVVRQFVAIEGFEWLWPEENNEMQQVSLDKFIIYGDEYKALRERIGEAAMKGEIDDLMGHLNDSTESDISEIEKEAFAILALFREITSLHCKQSPESEFCDNLIQCLKESSTISDHKLARMLVENRQGNGFDKLKCSDRINSKERDIAEIVIHTMVVLSLKKDNLLLQPLALMMVSPNDMQQSYLPTMPDDHLTEVFDAGAGVWRTYSCPNGHPYVVTECGQPLESRNCPECGAPIGGRDHVPNAGNVQAQRVDRTQTGHILGEPRQRLDYPVAERHLQPASLAVVSVFLHSSLLLGACNDENSVAQMIHAPEQLTGMNQAQMFIWGHLVKDIDILAKATGKSIEDTILLIHIILNTMLKNQEQHSDNFGSLASKVCRQDWEDQFNRTFIQPNFANLGTVLNTEREKLLNDKRLGANPIMRHLYELDIEEDEGDLGRPAFDYVRFWRFRTPVTVTDLKFSLNEFTAKKGKMLCNILKEFLDKESTLCLIKALPDIMKLQKIMSQKLELCIKSEEAQSTPIKTVLKNHFKGKAKEEVNALLKIYFAVWRALKPILSSQIVLDEDEDYEMTSSSPVGYLLPSVNKGGRRAVLLVKCLAEAHNELVEKCREIQGDKTKVKRVQVQEASNVHLVAYDHDADLVPMFYAHCDYSLEIGKGTTIDYNFPALERQLVDTLIRGKPLLDIEILAMKYADDLNSISKFEELEKRIEQRLIPISEQHQMAAEFHSLPEVCDALRAAEISIGLLSSTGAEPNVFYKKYLEDVLRMPASQFLVSGKMQSVCRLAHIRSIWLMLTVERAFRLYLNRQDPFDVEDMFRENIGTQVDAQVLRNIDIEHLLAEITEYIVLELQLREANAVDYPLKDGIRDYMDKKKSTVEVKGLDSLPDEVCLKHIYCFWQIVAEARKKIKT